MGNSSFTVHVPATTANLGPGFDCLGLALDLWNQITFSQEQDPVTITIEGEGSGILPDDKSNLIYTTIDQIARAHGKTIPENLHIHCQNAIPIASGLGSSAAAVIGGLVGAKKLLGLNFNDHDLLLTAAQIEGHADNAAACLIGGFILVNTDDLKISITQLKMRPLTAVVAVPDFSFSTESARKALPSTIHIKDAIFNINRAVELVHVLEKGNYGNLSCAMQDRLHQNHRLQLLPGSEAAMRAAVDAGAFGTCLSGAGPSVIAFCDQANAAPIGQSMHSAYKAAELNSRTLTLQCPSKGCFIS